VIFILRIRSEQKVIAG